MVGTAVAFVRINAERADAIAASEREQGERKKAQKALSDLEQSRKEADVVWKAPIPPSHRSQVTSTGCLKIGGRPEVRSDAPIPHRDTSRCGSPRVVTSRRP